MRGRRHERLLILVLSPRLIFRRAGWAVAATRLVTDSEIRSFGTTRRLRRLRDHDLLDAGRRGGSASHTITWTH